MESWINRMVKLKSIDSLNPQKNEVYLLDTCILMFNFYTAGSYKKAVVKSCNNLFTKIVHANAKILIYPQLMLEFFNLFIKLEYEMYLKTNNLNSKDFKYKEYRSTNEFSTVISELKEIYKFQIQPYAIATNTTTSVDDVFGFLDSISELDFNDILLCKVAKDNGAKLITHDSDFVLSSLVDNVDFYFV